MTAMKKLILVGGDLMATSRLEGVTRAAGAELERMPAARIEEAMSSHGATVVIDLDAAPPELFEALSRIVRDEDSPRLLGYYSHVNEDVAAQARAAGCEPIPRGRFWSEASDLLF